jgi:hypothetical protein
MLPLLLAILFFSCKDSSVNNQIQTSNGIFFEAEIVNYSWGFVYHGTMIDPNGNEYTYNPAKDKIPVLYNYDGYYTNQELQSKYQHAKTLFSKVSFDSLSWSQDLAEKVRTTDYSDTTYGGTDMPLISYSIYIFRPQIAKYQKIILRVEGGYIFYNKSESAIALVGWLKQVASQDK